MNKKEKPESVLKLWQRRKLTCSRLGLQCPSLPQFIKWRRERLKLHQRKFRLRNRDLNAYRCWVNQKPESRSKVSLGQYLQLKKKGFPREKSRAVLRERWVKALPVLKDLLLLDATVEKLSAVTGLTKNAITKALAKGQAPFKLGKLSYPK